MSPRRVLVDAWEALEERGAVVHRFDLAFAEKWKVAAATAEAHLRLRVLAEGDRVGWWPPFPETPLPDRYARLAQFSRTSPGELADERRVAA